MDACCSVTITQRSSKQLNRNQTSKQTSAPRSPECEAQAQAEHTAMLNALRSEWQIKRGFFDNISL
jgi:hypothetical protein